MASYKGEESVFFCVFLKCIYYVLVSDVMSLVYLDSEEDNSASKYITVWFAPC